MAPLPPPVAAPPVTVQPRTSGLAVASLVLGILWLGFVGSVLALVFGLIANDQITKSRGALTGKGMAIAGIILGAIPLAGLSFFAF